MGWMEVVTFKGPSLHLIPSVHSRLTSRVSQAEPPPSSNPKTRLTDLPH
jgi:hypothetical protein